MALVILFYSGIASIDLLKVECSAENKKVSVLQQWVSGRDCTKNWGLQ
jgi:hypothetical protein